jgi:hypothetical protein
VLIFVIARDVPVFSITHESQDPEAIFRTSQNHAIEPRIFIFSKVGNFGKAFIQAVKNDGKDES